MRRIGLVLALTLTLVPLGAEGQQPLKIPRIGLFHVGLDHDPPGLAPLRESLRRMGYEEGRNIRAAQAATSEIPVVFAHVSDPVAAGFVKSMARPGGNLTGVADYVGELQDKRVQIFGEMVRLRRLLILTDPTDPATQRLTADIERVAPQLKVRLVERHATTEADVTKIFASLKKGAVDGMVVISPKLITNFPGLILRLSLRELATAPSSTRGCSAHPQLD